jgi:hypothetical protein
VVVDFSPEFDRWFRRIEKEGGTQAEATAALLGVLTRLRGKPNEESATLQRIRRARRHDLWRVSHPFEPGVAVRLICWFPDDDTVVVALVGFDKKRIGNVFYESAVARGEAMVDAWLRQRGGNQ